MQEQERKERRRKYRKEWERAHYHTISTRVPIETAKAFEKRCKRHGLTVYAVLRDWIEDTLEHYK